MASIILVLSIVALSACENGLIIYSEKFQGIPIYPSVELVASTEYAESYEKFGFKDTFEQVKDFYMQNIDQEKWEIEENPLYPSYSKESFKSQGYMLKGEEEEVSLTILLQKTENKGNILYVNLNGSPFEEAKYNVEGKSENWMAFLEYVIRKEGIFIDGEVRYTGDNPPKEVDNKFLIYEIKSASTPDENLDSKSISQETQGDPLENSKFQISSQGQREYELEVYKEAINHGYIEIRWQEQGEEKVEKINIAIAE